MSRRAVILYGPPGAGKDTVTAALARRNPAYRLAQRLKAGPGRTDGYRMTTLESIDSLTSAGHILWRNDRYSSTYATDRPHLDQMLDEDLIPVLHLGQPEAIDAVAAAAPDISWTVAELWCPREVSLARTTARGTGDIDQRMAAYDQTPRLSKPTLWISTAAFQPEQVAARIDNLVRQSR
ncbi:kinase [Rhodococcus hoagii]|nr:kinase [Prescottella equi]MBM4654037.1 kinase [Prescottella equi]MBM4719700.1 kinase [Prescottella equi]NKR23497.1 kinase [Prescottella equi]NKT56349.1 kinase [Prescottella equi]